MLRVLFRRRLRLITITGATTDIGITAITTHTIMEAVTIRISGVATITGTAFGWPARLGIIAIGKRRVLGRPARGIVSRRIPVRDSSVLAVFIGWLFL